MKRDLLVIPQSLKGDIIKMFHDTPTGGHLGCDKTIAKVKQRAYWYELTRDISLHVATCRECSKSKCATLHPRAPLQCFQAGYPGDHIHLDMLSSVSTNEHGNKYVLISIDQFTRWLEMVLLHFQDANSVARAFFENYVVRWGCHVSYTPIKGGTLRVHSFTVSAIYWKLSKAVGLPTDHQLMGRLNATTS